MMPSIQNASVVIIGAGFSSAVTDGKTPLMQTFFDRLGASRFSLLKKFVEEMAGNLAEANVESVLLKFHQIRTSPFGAIKGWADHWIQNLPQIEKELSEYTLMRFGDCFDISYDNWAKNLIAECKPSTSIISMNYDNIAERILSNRAETIHSSAPNFTCPHCKMRMLLRVACSCEDRREISESDWRGAVIKLHGSISWKRCLNRNCCSFDCLVADEHCQPFKPCQCPACGESCGPVLIMPTMNKDLSGTREIQTMWQAAYQAITDADNLWLFGFSMPTSDGLFAQLMRQSISSGRKLKKVVVIDLDPNAVIGRLKQHCVPQDMVIEFVQLPVLPNQVPEWYAPVVAV